MQTVVGLMLLVSPIQAAEIVTFYHTDPVGTPILITDSSGQNVWESADKPFGEDYAITQSIENNRRFVGKERESETGLDYFGARYLSTTTGRFLTADPVRAVNELTGDVNVAILTNPQRLNTYTYSLNNPYRYVDPDGKIPIDTIWDLANIAYDIITGDKIALAADLTALALPYVPAGTTKLLKGTALVTDATKLKSPNFVVSPNGTVFPVPKGAVGPKTVINPSGKTTGTAFTSGRGGANGQVDTVRIMNPTPPRGKSPGYPNGYIKYENKSGQGVNPYTGRTISNKNSHFPID